MRKVLEGRAAVEIKAGTVLAAAVHEVKAGARRKATAFAVSDPNGNASPDGARHGRVEEGVGPVATGPILVSGVVVNALAAGSPLRRKRFVALSAAHTSLRWRWSAARTAVRIRRVRITVKAKGQHLQADERHMQACPPTRLARAKETWLRACKDATQ